MNNKLHLRVSRIVTLGALVFALIASAISYSYTQSIEADSMKKALDQLFLTVQRTAEIAAYLDSEDLAQEVIESLSGNDIVAGSMLSSVTGLIMIYNQRFDSDREALSYPLYAPFSSIEKVGEIKIQLNETLLSERVLKTALEQMVVLIIQILVVAILILIMVLRVLTYPIQSIAANLHRIVPGDNNQLNCPKGHENDEIGHLVADINNLLDSTRITIQQEQYLRNRIESLEKHFRLIFERASAGIFLLDREFYLDSVNQAFKDIAGIAMDERRADKQKIFLPDLFYESETVLGILREVMQTGKQSACDLRLGVVTNGMECWLHCLFSVVKNDEGESFIEGLVIDVTERTFQMERILFDSQHDELTKLFNRRAGEQLLNIMLTNAKNAQCQLAVLLIDLDGFKFINDNYGHDAGDKVLVEVSRRMQLSVRKEDVLIRWGGDEFVIAFQIFDSKDSEFDRIISKLQKQFEIEIELDFNHPVAPGASIGVAVFPHDGDSMEALIASADAAMYQVKKERKSSLTDSLLRQTVT